MIYMSVQSIMNSVLVDFKFVKVIDWIVGLRIPLLFCSNQKLRTIGQTNGFSLNLQDFNILK